MTPLERVKLLAEHWKTVDPSTVRLDEWSCGTHACLAGHAMRMPEFNAEGFTESAGIEAVPILIANGNKVAVALNACLEFFGTEDIFKPRYIPDFDQDIIDKLGFYINDYKLAAERMRRYIASVEAGGRNSEPGASTLTFSS